MTTHNVIGLFVLLIFVFSFSVIDVAHAARYQEIAPGDTITLGEFVFEDDFTPYTETPCTIGITNPLDEIVVASTTSMTVRSDGWHFFDYTATTSAPLGTWRSVMICGSEQGGDLIKADKSFIVATSTQEAIDESLATLPAAIWEYSDRTLTSFGTLVSDITTAVWGASTRSLTTFGNLVADITTAVWEASTRTLTGFGTLASDVWTNSTRLLTGGSLTDGGELATEAHINAATSTIIAGIDEIRESQVAGWTVSLSNFTETLAGETYRARLTVLNFESAPTDSFTTPTVTLYDASRNIVVEDVTMTKLSDGVYEFIYNIPDSAGAGVWETVVSTEVELGKIIQTNDFWEVNASPAQVIVNEITDNMIPSITANVTITNEGSAGFEYHYEYCIVDAPERPCSEGVDHAMAAKFILPGEDFTTDLTLSVAQAGTYYFKLLVYWGTERSVAFRLFTAIDDSEEEEPPPSPGTGSGAAPAPEEAVCQGADFNLDGIVDSADFSILLFFWKTDPPFSNPCVDINGDGAVDSIDFSILLYNWGTRF